MSMMESNMVGEGRMKERRRIETKRKKELDLQWRSGPLDSIM